MQSVVHDSGISQDPPCKQKLLAFKFASDAWVDANHDVVGVAGSKWKEMHPSEQGEARGRHTRAGADAAARSRVLAATRMTRIPLYLRGLLF